MKCLHPPNRAVRVWRAGYCEPSVVAYEATGREAGRPIEWYSKPKLAISAGS
jgi:hypothetical protein